MAKKLQPEETSDVIERRNLVQLDFSPLSALIEEMVTEREAAAEAAQGVGQICKRVEQEHGYNRAAFKQLVAFKKMSEDRRNDYLRTLLGGLQELNLMPPRDLVDLAEGT